MTAFGFMTDKYEFTMLQAFIKDGSVNNRAVFEVFTRRLPNSRRYGVFAGLGRLLPMIEEFTFSGLGTDWNLTADFLRTLGLDNDTLGYLYNFRFTGKITAYREGEIFFPNSPVLTVEGTLGECILLETLILSVLNHDSAIATTAARMVSSAAGRPIIEMGSRRTHEESAVAAARAAYIAGFSSTSNMLAGMRYGLPVTGTAAHAFTLAHGSETEAFASQIASQGAGTTLLVDTYNIKQGILNAVEAAQASGAKGPGAVRIDSGDLAAESFKARKLLDVQGARDTRIVVTSDLDEYVMKDLQDAPIDGYGVGTKLVSSAPMGFVYKLVSIERDGKMVPVHKKAKDKVSFGGKKTAVRVFDRTGHIEREVFSIDSEDALEIPNSRPLQAVVMESGKTVFEFFDNELDVEREFHKRAKAELPEGEQKVWVGDFGPFLTAEALS